MTAQNNVLNQLLDSITPYTMKEYEQLLPSFKFVNSSLSPSWITVCASSCTAVAGPACQASTSLAFWKYLRKHVLLWSLPHCSPLWLACLEIPSHPLHTHHSTHTSCAALDLDHRLCKAVHKKYLVQFIYIHRTNESQESHIYNDTVNERLSDQSHKWNCLESFARFVMWEQGHLSSFYSTDVVMDW